MVGANRVMGPTKRSLDSFLGEEQVTTLAVVGVVLEPGFLVCGRQCDDDALVGYMHP
jgi:hypothetical protein